MNKSNNSQAVIVIGCSAGGLPALTTLLSTLPETYPNPIIIVSHLAENKPSLLADILNTECLLNVTEAQPGIAIQAGTIYVAPAAYHLLLENDATLSLSVDKRINYCRPSIDVLFQSTAESFSENVIGIILTGGNNDGAAGLKSIREDGGTAIVQSPEEAVVATMPMAALKLAGADHVLSLDEIRCFLMAFSQ